MMTTSTHGIGTDIGSHLIREITDGCSHRKCLFSTAAAAAAATTTAADGGTSSSSSSSSTTNACCDYHLDPSSGMLIGYVTDIEGNYDYWENYLRLSKVVQVVSDGTGKDTRRTLRLRPNTMLVFGGDVCDRMHGDFRVMHDLTALRAAHGPSRVVIILGNRDLNKLRVVSELLIVPPALLRMLREEGPQEGQRARLDAAAEAEAEAEADVGVGVGVGVDVDAAVLDAHDHRAYWIRSATPPQDVAALAVDASTAGAEDQGDKGEDEQVQARARTRSQAQAALRAWRVGKMKWMLVRTMGAPLAFEMRRRELEELGFGVCDDYTVTQSFIDSLLPEPWVDENGDREMETGGYCSYSPFALPSPKAPFVRVAGLLKRYLNAGQIAYLHCNAGPGAAGSVLFVHGAVNTHNIGWMPEVAQSATEGSVEATDRVAHIGGYMLPDGGGNNAIGGRIGQWSRRINTFAHLELQQYNAGITQYVMQANLANSSASTASDGEANSNPLTPEESYRAHYWATGGQYDHPQPGSCLLQYGMGWMPDKSVNPSVVYANYLTDGRPTPPSDEFYEMLQDHSSTTSVGCGDAGTGTGTGTGTDAEAGDTTVRLIVTGHQPHGDCPLFLQYFAPPVDSSVGAGSSVGASTGAGAGAGGSGSGVDSRAGVLQVLVGDTSYSGDALWCSEAEETHAGSVGDDSLASAAGPTVPFPRPDTDPNTRGFSVSEAIIVCNGPRAAIEGALPRLQIYLHGILSNGAGYGSLLPASPSSSSPASGAVHAESKYIGRELSDGWWVKLPLCRYTPRSASGALAAVDVDAELQALRTQGHPRYSHYLLARSQKYDVVNRVLTHSQFVQWVRRLQAAEEGAGEHRS